MVEGDPYSSQKLWAVRAWMKKRIILPEQSRLLNLQFTAERELVIEKHVLPVTCHTLNSGSLPACKGPKLELFLRIYTLAEANGSLLKESLRSAVSTQPE